MCVTVVCNSGVCESRVGESLCVTVVCVRVECVSVCVKRGSTAETERDTILQQGRWRERGRVQKQQYEK